MMRERPLEDWEYPEPDIEDDLLEDPTETRPCPHCGAEVYEDAEQCVLCGRYVTFSSSPLVGWPAWSVAVVLLVIVWLVTWLLLTPMR